jgi:hypothetical protein
MSATPLAPRPEPARADGPGVRRAEEPGRAARGKWLAGAFSLAMLAIVASPVVENWKAEPRDSFPLSYYRMFSEDRADRQRLTYLVALDDRGRRYLIPYQFAGAGGMNQVRRQINRRVGQGEAAELCRSVAARLRRSARRPAGADHVEVITGTFRMSTYFSGNRAPLEEDVRARCRVDEAAR